MDWKVKGSAGMLTHHFASVGTIFGCSLSQPATAMMMVTLFYVRIMEVLVGLSSCLGALYWYRYSKLLRLSFMFDGSYGNWDVLQHFLMY